MMYLPWILSRIDGRGTVHGAVSAEVLVRFLVEHFPDVELLIRTAAVAEFDLHHTPPGVT
jgi:hypothetical protein